MAGEFKWTSDEPLIIPGSRKKAALVLVAAIALVAVGVFLLHIGHFWGWVMIGFFSLGIPVAIYMMLPGRNSLRLDRDGLHMDALVKPLKLRWSEVDEFYLATLHGNKMIGIRYSSSYGQLRLARQVAWRLSGMEGALPNQFVLPPEEVCETLNRWRAKFGVSP